MEISTFYFLARLIHETLKARSWCGYTLAMAMILLVRGWVEGFGDLTCILRCEKDDNYITLPSAKSAHPMVLDLNGDMKLDLLGYSADGESGLSMWINNVEPSTPANASSSMFNVWVAWITWYDSLLTMSSIYSSTASGMFDSAFTNQCTWAHPHSNAMVDLDGDCMGGKFSRDTSG